MACGYWMEVRQAKAEEHPIRQLRGCQTRIKGLRSSVVFEWGPTGRRLWPWLCMAHNLLLADGLFTF